MYCVLCLTSCILALSHVITILAPTSIHIFILYFLEIRSSTQKKLISASSNVLFSSTCNSHRTCARGTLFIRWW